METWAPLLLADPSVCLRYLVLRDLIPPPDNDSEERARWAEELRELEGMRETDPLIADTLALQEPDGSWGRNRVLGLGLGDRVRTTAQALTRLSYLGFGREHPVVERGVEYLYSQQRRDGAWPLPKSREENEEGEGYSMMPLQTAFPLRGLVACGYATDPRSERAFEWLLDQRLPDGAWPTGIASGNYGYVAGYRKLAHSRWGCRSNTTGALICLAAHPERRKSQEVRRGLDLLLGRETKEKHTLGVEIARLIGAEPARGFLTYFARFDLGLILDLCWRVGASLDDQRVADVVAFVQDVQGPYGLWEYPNRPQAARWVSFDLLRSLSRLDQSTGWISMEPRTPFQTYGKRHRRY
jgi:hypothetical protein